MKFSETISNQSTAGQCSSTCPKCCVRRPTPSPRSGSPQRFEWVRIGVEGTAVAPRAGPRPWIHETRLVLDRDGAAALALARVLAGAAVVAGLAAAHALAGVHALAAVLLRRGAAAHALARVQAGTAVGARLATALALARVHALARMLGHAAHLHLGARALVRGAARGRAEQQAAYGEGQHAGGQGGSGFLEVLLVHVLPLRF